MTECPRPSNRNLVLFSFGWIARSSRQHFRLADPSGPAIIIWMASLRQIIAALRREIDAAVQENAAAGGPLQMEPERVTLSLEVSIREQLAPDGRVDLSFDVLEAGAGQRGHTPRLSLEFKPIPLSSPAGPQPQAGQEKSRQLDAADAAMVMQSLSSIFGPPGFDSSARA